MANVSEIESLKIAAGKRTYFVDVKQSREGLKFLNITESKRLENGEYERHCITIFEENISLIRQGFSKSITPFPDLQKTRGEL